MIKNARDTAGNTAHHRQVDQGHDQRGGEHENDRDGQHAHEFTGHTGPEQHRQKGAKRRGRRGNHRPEHAFGRLYERGHGPFALIHFAVRIFDHNNRPIDEHTDGEDETEHHNVGDGDAHDPEQDKAQQEGSRDRKTHK